MNFNDIKRIYFIGIGGIGMSALARYFKKHGAEVHGYDKTATDLTRTLEAEGMSIHYEDDVKFIPQDVDLVVYTPAVPKEHKELNWFLARNFPVKKRAEVLGIISRSKRCVAIGGTHGKTTTSTMTTHLMRQCGIDATAFVGGISGNLGTNFIEGNSDWVVVEADEYDRSFLHLTPEIAVLNSIDPDHLDIYGTADEVAKSYAQFASQTKAQGAVLMGEQVWGQIQDTLATASSFGIGEKWTHRAENVRVEAGYMVFDYQSETLGAIAGLKLPYPGLHNVRNAVAAISATLIAGGDRSSVAAALQDFKGVKRRFEYIVRQDNLVYIDDYAHHPVELEAAISAARLLYPEKSLTGVFQPHLYTRTRDFADGFAQALDLLDTCILLEIYPARESPIEGVSAEMLAALMKRKSVIITTKTALLDVLQQHNPEVLMTMGAGDIDTMIKPIREMLLKKQRK